MIQVCLPSHNWFWSLTDFGFAWTWQLLSLTMPEEQNKDTTPSEKELREAALRSSTGPARQQNVIVPPATGTSSHGLSVSTCCSQQGIVLKPVHSVR